MIWATTDSDSEYKEVDHTTVLGPPTLCTAAAPTPFLTSQSHIAIRARAVKLKRLSCQLRTGRKLRQPRDLMWYGHYNPAHGPAAATQPFESELIRTGRVAADI